MKCTNCGIEFEGRADARFCSPKCRKEAFLKRSIGTDNGTDKLEFKAPSGTDNFEFTVPYNKQQGELGHDSDVERIKQTPRTAKYWYDVPLAAVPLIKEGWPQKPDFMSGRQYFLWWKNEFQEGKKGPVIHNPY